MLKGTIVKGIGGFYYVQTEEGLIECRARGRFRKDGESPVVGDLVTVKPTLEDAQKGSLEEILPRKNVFIRPPVANIDQLVVTLAVTSPAPNLRLVDRLTVSAEAMGVTPVICINKVDLDSAMAHSIAAIYEKTGYRVILSSRCEDMGLIELKEILQDKITALAGNSGVGKSSIINRLGAGFALETGSVSEKTQRGRHTTRHTELFKLPFGGYVFDTPGFSAYGIENITKESLSSFFPDIARHEGGCRFSGCAHVAEPDCSVKEALMAQKIAPERYESYVALYNEAKELELNKY